MTKRVLQLGQSNPSSAINVAPLIDVCLVLLVIFMIVTPLIKNPVELPPASSGHPYSDDDRPLTITLTNAGLLSAGSVVLAPEQLPSHLRALYAQQPNRQIVVRADKRLQYGAVRDMLRSCRQAGFNDVTLAVTRPTA